MLRLYKLIDVVINVFLPILLGVFIYFLKQTNTLSSSFITNYLADGLWAFSLTSAILIIWNRVPSWLWQIIIFILFVLFEILQYYKKINGTADVYDVVVYFTYAAFALALNPFYKKKFHNQNKTHEIN